MISKRDKEFSLIKIVEKWGNRLPHPFVLFGIFILIILLLSNVLNKIGFGVDDTLMSNKYILVENLLSFNHLRELIEKIPDIYIRFPSLKIVLLMMMAIGLVEKVGFFNALMRKYLLGVPKSYLTAALIFTAINANVMSDAGTIFAITMGGILFSSVGRSPKLGIIVGFAAASGGFTANIFVAGTDALLAGITQEALLTIGKEEVINPLCNYYFMVASTVVLTITLTLFTEKFIVKYVDRDVRFEDLDSLSKFKLNIDEERGLKYSFYSIIIFFLIMIFLTVPQNSFFRNPQGSFLPTSPLMTSITTIIFFLFSIIGITYGVGKGAIKTSKDVVKLFQEGVIQAAPLMVTLLSSSIFIYLLNKSNIFKVLSIKGAMQLKDLNMNSYLLLIMVILITTLINPIMTSGSTKWVLLAPMVVPMFSILGISPAYAQLAFRIGDSATNIISPLQPALPVVLGLLYQYQEKDKIDGEEGSGFGSVFSLTLPYSIVILFSLIILLTIWYHLELPIGPGIY